MVKVIQTVLNEEEYRTLRDVLRRKNLSLKEGLHVAVMKLLQEETRVSPSDPFLVRQPAGRSSRGDLSKAHDKYLYGEKRR
jgi:hypothetical protein